MTTMIAELHAVADTTIAPTHADPIELSQTMQCLHVRDMLEYDDDGADEEGLMILTSHLCITTVPKMTTNLMDHYSYSIEGPSFPHFFC